MPSPRKPSPSRSPTALTCCEVAAAFGAALVKVLERRARQFELPGGLEADGAVGAGQRDDLAAFLDRLPAELGQADQQVADAARLVPRRRAMIARADRRTSHARCRCATPRAASRRPKRSTADRRGSRSAGSRTGRCAWSLRSRPSAPRIRASIPLMVDSETYRQSPAAAIHAATAASAAVSARRMRGPRLIACALGAARIAAASSGVKPPSGPVRISAGPGAKAAAAGSPPVSSAK